MSDAKRIDKLERQVSELMQRTSNLPVRLAQGKGGANVPDRLVVLNGDLNFGAGASANFYDWNQDTNMWEETDEDVVGVLDFRQSGDSIPSGNRCVVTKINGIWWVISTECP